jgi:hypothetical protein
MVAFDRTARSSKRSRPVLASVVGSHVACPGVYLTDETFLYRIARVLGTGRGDTVELEDCYLLDCIRVPLKDLDARRLRVVTPAPAPG